MDYSETIFKNPPTRINHLIKQSGKKLKQISEESGVPYGALSSYNQGIRTPKKDNATRLARYFKVSLPYLMGLDDEPQLRNPADEGVLVSIKKMLTEGTTISSKIDEWTPFKDDTAMIISDFQNHHLLLNYIDFVSNTKPYNEVILRAYKQAIETAEKNFLYLLNSSSDPQSPYHYVWEAWKNSDEYKEKMKNNQQKKPSAKAED